jgi:cytochrome P450
MPMTIPRVRGLPVIGNLPEFRRNRLDLYLRVSRECGDIGMYRVGSRTIILLNSAELAQAVLVEHADALEKPRLLRTLTEPVLGNGLLTSQNEFHKRQRKLVAPAFQHRRIAAYADVMAQYAERLQQEWADGANVDVAHEMMRLTLWIVGKTLFDVDVLDEAEELGEALETMMRSFTKQVGSLVPIPPSWPTLGNRRLRRATERLDATIYRIIRERRASGVDRGDLLSILLQSSYEHDGSFMSDRQVHDEAMTLFLAGHETTANALDWSWYLLAQHPEIYARMRTEVDEVLMGRTPTFADLSNLPYTLRVLKEAMRLYPPAPAIGRQAVRPVEIGGYHLPARTLTIVSPYALHRRADYFADPEHFNPDRWTPEMEVRLPRHAYLPFGGGPRICIGNHFAMMEGQIILATLAQRVIFNLVPGQRIKPEPLLTLRPRDGINMIVQRREVEGSGYD